MNCYQQCVSLFLGLAVAAISLPVRADEASVLFWEWEKGIAIQSRTEPKMVVYLWFYEWNMFDARQKGDHTSGSYKFERKISKDGKLAVIRADGMTLTMKATTGGAELSLEIRNQTDHTWPRVAGIIPCFNPGPPKDQTRRFPLAKLNPQFDNRNTWYVGRNGLAKLDKREIHFNAELRKQVDAKSSEGKFPFSFKWPTSEKNAHAGLMLRESSDERWVTGIAWDRFLSAQGHNPWQCMHLAINVGPLDSGKATSIRGRIYLFEGDKEECYRRYKADFPKLHKD